MEAQDVSPKTRKPCLSACIGEEKLFSSTSALVIFVSYMSLFIAQVTMVLVERQLAESFVRMEGFKMKL